MFSKLNNVNRQSGKEKKTELIYAIEKNNVKKFQSIINNADVDINLGDLYYRTPLMYAFFTGRMEFVNALLQKGANLNLADASGRTIFYYYAESGNIEIVKALVSIGVNINDYNYKLEKHCLNIMSSEMLQTLFLTAKPGDILKTLRNSLVSNTVRKNYIAFLIKMQQWERLVLLYSQLPYNARDLRLLVCETLPVVFFNNQIRNTCFMDSVAEGNESLAVELLRQGADINQKDEKSVHILKMMSAPMQNEVFVNHANDLAGALVNPVNELFGSEICERYLNYLHEKKEYEKIKEVFYASLKYSKHDGIGKLLMKLFGSLPEQETDQKITQAVFRYAGKSLAEEFIREGFDCNYSTQNGRHVLHEVDGNVRVLIFKYVQPEFIIPALKAYSKNSEEAKTTNNIAVEYGTFLASGKNWEVLKNLIKCDFVERSHKATMYESIPDEIRDEALKNFLQGVFPERLTAFDDIPAGLFSFSTEEVIAIVKNNTDSEYSLSIIAKKIEPDGYTIRDRWENCSVCNGTGIVGNFDAALERDCYSYDCGFCHGKGKVRTELIVYKNDKVIWRK